MANVIGRGITATAVSTFRTNLKDTLDAVYNKNQTLIVTRPDDHNVVVISEKHFNEIQKMVDNLEYLLKLAKSDKEIETGDVSLFNLDNM